jgi:tRNA-dihydrouridine synthase
MEEDDEQESGTLGHEFINKIEVNYCSLCREYLSRNSKDEKVISDHCKSKKHLKWYYQSKKKDEKLEKAKEAAETAAKEAVTSTSIQDSDKAAKEAEEKNDETKETEDSDVVTLTTEVDDETAEESSKNFPR